MFLKAIEYMIKKISAHRVTGQLHAPASKSVAQRAIAIACLAHGTSQIVHPGTSEDVLAAIGVARALGADVEQQPDRLIIKGGVSLPREPLHCGEAGLGIRMFSAIAATLNQPVILTGEGSLCSRPMDMICSSLQAAGATCEASDGKIPIRVQGPLPGGVAHIDGSVSSQVLTGLLIAAAHARQDVTLKVHDLKSRPYVDITTQMMMDFGVEVENRNYQEFVIPAPQNYQARTYVVEGDWSGAAFLLVAGALGGHIRLENLDMHSPQADRAIMEALKSSGASIRADKSGIEINKVPLHAFNFDATHCPDLFPPLVALAAGCKGLSVIKGVGRLKVKESDRALALVQEFSKLGLGIHTENDNMYIQGGNVLKSARVHSHHDHRIAMACAVASLLTDGCVEIEEAQVVAKSYPGFYEDFARISGE